MKYVWILCLCLIFSGCDIEKFRKEIHKERDAATVSSSFFLLTVVHDEHLFIIRHNCGILHHPNCPCLKNAQLEKIDNEPKAPIIFLNPFNPVK